MKNIKKNKNFFLLAPFIILLIIACKNSLYNGPTNHGASTINVNGISREYIMYVPSTYDSKKSVPLMLIFHGWTMSAYDQMKISDMRGLAESEKFILVYPQGTIFKGSTHWNVGSWTTGSTSDDLGFVDELINHISAKHNIDMKRIYAAGYSNGGFFSQELACNLSNNIAAIGTVVANMSTRTKDNCNPSHPIPLVTISGTKDRKVSYDGTNFKGQISHDSVLNYWISYNQTDTSPIMSDLPNINKTDRSTVKLYQYKNGKNNVEIEHYKIINGRHDWPGTFGNMDINANSIIWNFVSQFDINGKI
jgi:polyhydroxybutyrate depolymerase